MPAPDHRKALKLLQDSLATVQTFRPKSLSQAHQADIAAIIEGTHLTFRYILITALLAKVTEPDVHMRSLQSGADLSGAYDARSLCHKVWVPFEHDHLDCKLGGSNEPYLNKPARFPAVAKTNAARGGRDKRLLDRLHDLLESLNKATLVHQREAFLYAMTLIYARDGATIAKVNLAPITISMFKCRSFARAFLSASHGGETAAATVGAAMTLHFGKGHQVKIHPANQAGSSSNETGDIDVYEGKSLVLAIEVKDKAFGRTDIEHAVNKATCAGCRLLFVSGEHAIPGADVNPPQIATRYAEQGTDVSFATVDEIVMTDIALLSESQRREFIQLIKAKLTEMRAKDETKAHFDNALRAVGLDGS